MATVKKIKLRSKNGGAEIEITPSAYQMRKSKYDKTHTIVKEAPVVTLPSIPPAVPDGPPHTGDTESEELDVHEESETKTEKKGPGRPKKQAE